MTVEFQFLDARGQVLTLQPYGAAGTPTARTLEQDHVHLRGPSAPQDQTVIKRPASD